MADLNPFGYGYGQPHHAICLLTASHITCTPSAYVNLKRIETQNYREDLVLAITDAEHVKKPKLPDKRLLKRTGKKTVK